MTTPTLLGLCGSLRAASLNRKLMHEAARRFGPAEFTEGDLRLPLYDGDLEDAHGIPAPVQALVDAIAGADAVIVACPEYNQSLPGVLKNGLDWVSRTDGAPWRDKPVALMSAAAGRAGGARAQFALRLALVPFRRRGARVRRRGPPDQRALRRRARRGDGATARGGRAGAGVRGAVPRGRRRVLAGRAARSRGDRA